MAQDFARSWNESVLREREEMQAWIATLRAQTVRAAMADDGRVDRQKSVLRLDHPDFLDSIYFGAIVALGTPKSHRLVQIVKPVTEGMLAQFGNYYHFVPYDPNKIYWMRQKSVTGIDEWEYMITDKKPDSDGK